MAGQFMTIRPIDVNRYTMERLVLRSPPSPINYVALTQPWPPIRMVTLTLQQFSKLTSPIKKVELQSSSSFEPTHSSPLSSSVDSCQMDHPSGVDLSEKSSDS
ncbi:hypothetical protein COOONC_06397 [Cooperia oncophora]